MIPTIAVNTGTDPYDHATQSNVIEQATINDSHSVPLPFTRRLSDSPPSPTDQHSSGPFTMRSLETPSIRQKIAFYLDTEKAGRFLDLSDALLSAAQCLLFISNTTFIAPPIPDVHSLLFQTNQLLNTEAFRSSPYYDPTNRRINAIPLPTLNIIFELILSICLVGLLIFRTYVAPSRSFFLTSSYAILTGLATFPVLLAYTWAYFDSDIYLSYMSAGPIVFAFPIRWARLHEVLSMVFMPVKDPLFRMSPIARKTINVSCAIFFTLLTVSGLIHITLYKDERQLANDSTYMDIFFFTVMSSTSGLSTTITADSWFTRFLLLYIMIAGAFYIPTHLSELLDMVKSRSKFTKPFSPPGNNQSHVVVTGTFDANAIIEFLREFYCPDHGPGTITTTVIFLNPDEPSDNLKSVLQDPAYMSRVRYIKGTATSFHALDDAHTRDAQAVFLVSSKLASETGDSLVDDAETVMRALAIKKYCPNLPCFVQSLLPENQSQFHYLADEILCVDELTLGILAQSARVPGFSAFISLLCSSMTEKSRLTLVRESEEQGQGFLKPYVRGAANELYVCTFPKALVGLTFAKVSCVIYNRFGACLIALGTHVDCLELPASLQFHLVLNPATHIITGTETGFVIGTESEVVRLIKEFNGPVDIAVNNYPNNNGASQELDLHAENTHEPSNFIYRASSLAVPGTPQPLVNKIEPDSCVLDSDEDHHLLAKPIEAVPMPINESYSETSSMAESINSGGFKDSPVRNPVSKQSLRHMRKNFRSLVPQSMQDKATGALLHKSQHYSKHSQLEMTEYPDEKGEGVLNPTVRDHVILCDASPNAKLPEYIDLFIEPLRDHRIVTLMPVVILSMDDPPKSVFKYEHVFHVRGNPMRRIDLHRAGITRSAKLVICCSQKSTRRVADAGSILCALNAESISHQYTFPVIEFVWKENMKYVGDTKVLNGLTDGYAQTILRPSFMAGHAFSASLLDGVLAQSYYSPHLISLIKRLIFPGRKSLLEKLIVESNPNSSPTSPSNSPTSILPLQDTYIHLLDVGRKFHDRKYLELYTDLANHNIVPLGLYRTIENSLTDLPISFTLVNPRQFVLLRKGDKVFVLSPQRH